MVSKHGLSTGALRLVQEKIFHTLSDPSIASRPLQPVRSLPTSEWSGDR